MVKYQSCKQTTGGYKVGESVVTKEAKKNLTSQGTVTTNCVIHPLELKCYSSEAG